MPRSSDSLQASAFLDVNLSSGGQWGFGWQPQLLLALVIHALVMYAVQQLLVGALAAVASHTVAYYAMDYLNVIMCVLLVVKFC